MKEMETKNPTANRIKSINHRFSEKYFTAEIEGRSFFFPDREDVFAFAVDSVGNEGLVLEYADSEDDLVANRLEDGDRFPLDMTEEEMFTAMLREIEDS